MISAVEKHLRILLYREPWMTTPEYRLAKYLHRRALHLCEAQLQESQRLQVECQQLQESTHRTRTHFEQEYRLRGELDSTRLESIRREYRQRLEHPEN